jgi:hypothetical protein
MAPTAFTATLVPASHEQSVHPEFPQLQPIAKMPTNNVIIFFIIFIF